MRQPTRTPQIRVLLWKVFDKPINQKLAKKK